MKTQFTPGPWQVNSPYIEDQHGTIAKVMRPEANAALIAAAPDLFEALESIMTACEGATLPKNMMIHLTDARTKARAALAKAKGVLC